MAFCTHPRITPTTGEISNVSPCVSRRFVVNVAGVGAEIVIAERTEFRPWRSGVAVPGGTVSAVAAHTSGSPAPLVASTTSSVPAIK